MRHETKRCPVCRGAGTKGRGLFHILSDCFACAGTGKVEVRARRPDRHADLDWHRQVMEARS